MRTPPDSFDVRQLSTVLAEGWHLSAVDLQYAPVGFGSHHWVATDASGNRRFVTADELDQQNGDVVAGTERLRRALTTAQTLRDEAGLTFVVAPLPAVDGAVLRTAESSFAVAVYPFIDGTSFPDGDDATAEQREDVLRVLAKLHEATPAVQASAGVDDLALAGRRVLEEALRALRVPWTGGPYAEPTRELLSTSASDVTALLREYDRLAEAVGTNRSQWVITHGEPKADNLLATAAGVRLVDWDTTLLAPAARDVWMVDRGAGEEAGFYTTSTGRPVNPGELTYYRLRWALTDIASFVGWFRAPHDQTADTDIAWNALALALRLREHWPEFL